MNNNINWLKIILIGAIIISTIILIYKLPILLRGNDSQCNELKIYYDCHIKAGNFYDDIGYRDIFINCTGSSDGLYVEPKQFLKDMIKERCFI